MEMEQNWDTMELEQMREQLATLNRKLDHETIVNEKMIREIIKNKIAIIDRIRWRSILIAALGIFYCPWALFRMGVSWWFWGITIIFLIVAALYTYFAHQEIRANDMIESNLLEISQKICKLKSRYSKWLKIGIPFVVIWGIWFVIEIVHSTNNEHERIILLCACIIGLIIGSILGFCMYRKMQGAINNILQQIDDFTHKNI